MLGWGVLTYLLALSPGLLANDDPVCVELSQQLSVEELQSSRGLVAKIVCPSLRTESTPLDTISEIESLNHDDLLSLFSTELRQLGYLIYEKHHGTVVLERTVYKLGRLTLYSKYYLSPEAQANGLPFPDGQYEKFKTLPNGLLPVAPIHETWSNGVNPNGFYYSSQHFIQPTAGLPEVNVERQGIDLQQLSGKELLDFSPVFFLTRHGRPAEAILLTKNLYSRSDDADFLLSAKRALGVISEAYPMYFITTDAILADTFLGRNTPLGRNLERAMGYVFNYNIYVYVLSTRNDEVIANLINGLCNMGMIKDEFPAVYSVGSRLTDFNLEMVYDPLLNTEIHDEGAIFLHSSIIESALGDNGASYNRETRDKYGGKVAEFENSKITYTNITISDI
ncbi:hypothetical protein IWQ62_005871 [Dispira parvispora]|uniref:Gingipain domain-containing protein n=1 Tax=Dispira parvispora TaxID=1520584 RepID=A0A9W8DZ66_9FUNG|nr:hypothetical protein IWQ62_005871 [Dispira parvispora]